ncbi:MAG: Gfo/Idh/MocA family oxidoreductase, partial [Lentisphaeria bacterium]|nr:Gfo/Idh/MocA family oxidoreductase [Lentisphaeria bacterium]
MKPLRYGIIGLGQISTKGHIPALMGMDEAHIVAVADVSADALTAAAETIGKVTIYTDYHDLLADPNVEAVLIATPNWLHKEQAVAAFDAGKHVFCEKPLGIDLEECEAILAAQRRSGKLLQVGHEMRYSKLFQTAREKVVGGLIGRVQMMVFQEFRFPLLPGWRQTGRTGGLMLEKNSHVFDLFNWFADSEPVRVVGTGGNNVNRDSPLIDNCVVTVEYANGTRATAITCLFSEYGSQPT